MNVTRLAVTLMMLLNLGLTLGADLFATDIHESVSLQSETVLQSKDALFTTSDRGPAGQTLKECFDVCHTGGCHFGHCSVAFKAFTPNLFISIDDRILRTTNDDEIEEPSLEGIRRPPKAS